MASDMGCSVSPSLISAGREILEAQITETIARKVLETVDAGLCKGKGEPVPGSMCVEAAVVYALGLPHSDDPKCVSRALRELKIRLNDSNWSSNQARAKGLRRLALIQLGTAGAIDDKEFARRVAELAIRKSVPLALRAAASIQKDAHHANALRDAALLCERDGDESSARKARAAAYAADDSAADSAASAAYAADAAAAAESAADSAADSAESAAYAARDKSLADFAEGIVQILIEMKSPGAHWLALTEQETAP